jgi:hypothetical protein
MASSQFDVLEWLAAGYLLLPLLVFLLGWLRWPFALAMGAALAPALYHAWRGRVRRPAGLSRTEVLALAAVAISWVSMSGLAPGFFLNWDWMTRMSVLRDLVAGDWPAGYRLPGEADLVLRCPLGYYLVPALVGKLTSLAGPGPAAQRQPGAQAGRLVCRPAHRDFLQRHGHCRLADRRPVQPRVRQAYRVVGQGAGAWQ